MKKIRIVSIPKGEAPEWVREAWIGLEIPIVKEEPEGAWSIGPITRRPYTHGGYWVQRNLALKFLLKKNLEAFQWWLDLIEKQEGTILSSSERLFLFDTGCCEVIE